MNLEAVEAFLASFPEGQDRYRYLQFAILRLFYSWLAKRHKYPPARLAFSEITPKREKKVRKSLSAEQVLLLLQLDLSPRDRLIIETFLGSGIRAGELLGLRPEDAQDGDLTVTGKSGERTIQISPALERSIRAAAQPGQPVFVSVRGKPLTRDEVYSIVQKHLRAIGIVDAKQGPHRLRHTYGRLYLEHGGDLESLRQQLGHADLATTAVYAELSRPQVRKRAMSADPLEHAQRQLHLDEALEVPHGQSQESPGS